MKGGGVGHFSFQTAFSADDHCTIAGKRAESVVPINWSQTPINVSLGIVYHGRAHPSRNAQPTPTRSHSTRVHCLTVAKMCHFTADVSRMDSLTTRPISELRAICSLC